MQMKTILVAAAFLTSNLALPLGSLELKGDKIGESLEVFKKKYPKAECQEGPPHADMCMMWAGVTIANAPAVADPDCSILKYWSQYTDGKCAEGMEAQFEEHKLLNLTYTVSGTYRAQVTSTLREKYGTPTLELKNSATWFDAISILDVHLETVGKAERTVVMLSRKKPADI